jgi:histidine triad (HIT) family protein
MESQPTQEELNNMSPEQIAELQKKNCIFCKMSAGEIPTYKIYEDSKVFAILDINPANDGHVLLLPKDHYQMVPMMPPELLSHMMIIAKKISQIMLSVLKVRGVSLMFEIGEAAGQKAPHVMLHIIPSSHDKKILQPDLVDQDETKFQEILKKLRTKTGFQVEEPKVDEEKKVSEQEVKSEEKTKVKLEDNKELNLDSISKLF